MLQHAAIVTGVKNWADLQPFPHIVSCLCISCLQVGSTSSTAVDPLLALGKITKVIH